MKNDDEKDISEQKFCSNCGKNYSKGAKFCKHCGIKFGEHHSTADTRTSVRLILKIDKGFTSRESGFHNKQFNIVLDNRIIKAFPGRGKYTKFDIPAGRHTLTLKGKWGGSSNTLETDTTNEDTIYISSYFDLETKKLYLVNEKDWHYANTLKKLVRRKRAYYEACDAVFTIGILTLIPGVAFVIFNVNIPELKNYAFDMIPAGLIFIVLGFFVKKITSGAYTCYCDLWI